MSNPEHVCQNCGAASGGTLWYRAALDDFSFITCRTCGVTYRLPPLYEVINYSRYGAGGGKRFLFQGPSDLARGAYLFQKFSRTTREHSIRIEGKRILDIGCGPGNLLKSIRETFDDVALVGLDPSEVYLNQENEAFERIVRPIEEASLPKDHFDIVSMYGNFMLHKSPKRTLSILFSTLKPGGFLLFDFKNPLQFARRIWRLTPTAFRRRLPAMERQIFHGANYFLTTGFVDRVIQDVGFAKAAAQTSHSYNIAEGRSPLLLAIRALDDWRNQRAWTDYVCRKPVRPDDLTLTRLP